MTKKCFILLLLLNFLKLCKSAQDILNINKDFVLPENLEDPGREYVNLGFNFQLPVDLKQEQIQRYMSQLRRFLYSIFIESTGTSINFLIFTDSKEQIVETFKETIGRVLNRNLLSKRKKKDCMWKFPRFKIQFISIGYLQEKYQKELDLYKSTLCDKKGEIIPIYQNRSDFSDYFDDTYKKENVLEALNMICDQKYAKDIFYIQFFFGLELPSFIKTIIQMDIDLRLRIDVGQLNQIFQHMNRGEIFGLAKEWHNVNSLRGWRYQATFKETSLGLNGPFQGLNSGIVLINLDRLRKIDLVTPQSFAALKLKYEYAAFGDQSAYHLLRYNYPNLVYMIPCLYNFMVHVSIPYGGFRPKYNECLGVPFIQHLCGELSSTSVFPVLSRYNYLMKFSTWCWDPTWVHCF